MQDDESYALRLTIAGYVRANIGQDALYGNQYCAYGGGITVPDPCVCWSEFSNQTNCTNDCGFCYTNQMRQCNVECPTASGYFRRLHEQLTDTNIDISKKQEIAREMYNYMPENTGINYGSIIENYNLQKENRRQLHGWGSYSPFVTNKHGIDVCDINVTLPANHWDFGCFGIPILFFFFFSKFFFFFCLCVLCGGM